MMGSISLALLLSLCSRFPTRPSLVSLRDKSASYFARDLRHLTLFDTFGPPMSPIFPKSLIWLKN